jgi:hypothetical protein
MRIQKNERKRAYRFGAAAFRRGAYEDLSRDDDYHQAFFRGSTFSMPRANILANAWVKGYKRAEYLAALPSERISAYQMGKRAYGRGIDPEPALDEDYQSAFGSVADARRREALARAWNKGWFNAVCSERSLGIFSDSNSSMPSAQKGKSSLWLYWRSALIEQINSTRKE